MTEEPYRWLDAVQNRRDYVRNQLAGATPVFAASLDDGLLLFGVGIGNSKVFEIFDRHALAGLGHPADLERLRQGLIDAAHLESFSRAAEDVSLRRLVAFGLAPQLKTAFEQIFAPPFLARLLLAEVGPTPAADVLVRVHFDGSFDLRPGGVMVVTDDPQPQPALETELRDRLAPNAPVATALSRFLEVWWRHVVGRDSDAPAAPPSQAELADALKDRVVEAALLRRQSERTARYFPLDPFALAPELLRRP